MKLRHSSLIYLCISLLFLPVSSLAAEVKAVTLLKKGAVLTDGDIEITVKDNEVLEDVRASYIGKEMKRTVYAGHFITRSFIGPRVMVKRNGPVTMVYQYGTMKLTAKGRALNSGSIGDSITVMNIGSRKKVYGVITGPEIIEVSR